jgi:leukotriene-A4 hydrolase
LLPPLRSFLTVGFICADIPYEFGEDPDEFYSSVACEHPRFFFSSSNRNTGTPALSLPLTVRIPADDKGANFLYYLEKLVGGVEVFNPYQKAYIQAFEGKSLTTQQWEEHFWCVPARDHAT